MSLVEPTSIDLSDESVMTEITILPDGRVYVFGTSRQMLELLHCLYPADARIAALHAQARRAGSLEQSASRRVME